MYKQTQYLSNESFKPFRNTTDNQKSPISVGEEARQRSVTCLSSQIENYSEQRLNQIKRKHGVKERVTTEQYQSKPLRDITLKSSNYDTFKSIEKDEKSKSKSSSVFKSILLNSQNQPPFYFNDQNKISDKLERKSQERSDIRESIVSRVDEFRDIPKFGGKSSKWGQITVSKSIEVPVENSSKVEEKGSIDKIKAKFDHILNYFNDNDVDKNLEKYRPEYLQYRDKLSKVESVERITQISKSKVYVQAKDDAFNKYYVPGRASRHADSMESRARGYSAHCTPLENAKARCSYLPPENSQQQESAIKIKNVDEEIRRIEERIKRSHQEKRKLDINEPNRENADYPRRLSCYSKSPIDKSVVANRRHKLYGNVPPIRLKTQEIKDYVPERTKPSDRVRQSERLITEEYVQQQPSYSYSNSNSNSHSHSHSYNRMSAGPSNDGQTTRRDGGAEMKRLVEALKLQVELDEKLRNAKVIYSYSNNNNKWSQIKQILENHRIPLSESQVQMEFDVTLEQHNPFFSVRESKQTSEELVQRYVESHRHWNSNVLHNFNPQTLKKQGLNEESIDLEKKGHLNIEDLVRFLNFKTKNFYRNRDLVLLFRRVSSKHSVTHRDLLSVLCKS